MGDAFPTQPQPSPDPAIADRAARVRLVLTDVDGVLTSSQVIYGPQGERLRAFSTRDGAAIQWLIRSGIPVGFLSALDDPSTRKRGEDLGVRELHLGVRDKLAALDAILERSEIEAGEIAYFGDDLLDLPVLLRVGFPACPSDAAQEVKEACAVVLPLRGGEGFFRSAAEFILKAQDRWSSIVASYQAPR
jgi:3-deoxy-D-manno-octulosonate 8-phosphate phosphatase (KDO 8-P phosphatase)